MSVVRTTDEEPNSELPPPGVPGVLVVHTPAGAAFRAVPARGPLRVGRDDAMELAVDDGSMSREHAEIVPVRDRWRVSDRGSRNGTFVNGERITQPCSAVDGALVRTGGSVFLLCGDVQPFDESPEVDGFVASVRMKHAFARVTAAAAAGHDLLITGESGTGKELAARWFHRCSPHGAGPLVDTNCATIPEALAERLLFGARRGAFSGADADAAGLFTAADGGVAFLDEVGELDPRVQAKLLRFIENREVVPLGATKGRKVSLQICFATLRDLQGAVANQRFRADLYHRISSLRVELPALRERREEIPWLIAAELTHAAPGLRAHAKFVEACMLRVWPGNVRELRGEVRRCAQEAILRGKGELRASDLGDVRASEEAAPPTSAITREAIVLALSENKGNVAATARALGLHRRQLYRLLERYAIHAAQG